MKCGDVVPEEVLRNCTLMSHTQIAEFKGYVELRIYKSKKAGLLGQDYFITGRKRDKKEQELIELTNDCSTGRAMVRRIARISISQPSAIRFRKAMLQG